MNDQRVLGQFETLKNTGTVELSTSRGKPHSVSTDPELEVQWDEVEGMGLAHGQYGPPEVREQHARRQAEAQAEAYANAAARDPRAERPRASNPQE